ncbi:unnamed protein product [Pedinophyceae sp. YPF-701]|nr:unnamed protein product [Pedinophyceae sp. YPF-701]
MAGVSHQTGCGLSGVHTATFRSSTFSRRPISALHRRHSPDAPSPGPRELQTSATRAGASAADDGGRPAPKKPKGKLKRPREPAAARALSLLLRTSHVPTWSYVPEPVGPLHRVDPRIKQLWLFALLVVIARAPVPFKALAAGLVVLLSVVGLPVRVWRAQLMQLGLFCSLLAVGLLLGAEGVPPVTQTRAPPVGFDGLPAIVPEATYGFVLAKLGPLTITRRSLSLAVTSVALTIASLQGASLCLVTTKAEDLAQALTWYLSPLAALGVPVASMAMTLLLSIRFVGVVFTELQNLLRGLAARGVDWRRQGLMGTLDLMVGLIARLLDSLISHCGHMARAMSARGYRGPAEHRQHLAGASPSSPVANAVALASLVALAAAAARV